MQQVNVWEIVPSGSYIAASHFGPTYNGPLGQLQFTNGRLSHVRGFAREYAYGYELQGAKQLCHFWPYHSDHQLIWIGDSWDYVPCNPVAELVDELRNDGIVVGDSDCFTSLEQPPVENENELTKRRARRVRCSNCEGLFLKKYLADGLCDTCR